MARGTLTSELTSLPDDPEAVFAHVERQGWGDGFPVIPPTEARVQAMLEATPLPPSHLVGVIEPRRGEGGSVSTGALNLTIDSLHIARELARVAYRRVHQLGTHPAPQGCKTLRGFWGIGRD